LKTNRTYRLAFIGLLIAFVICFLGNIALGSVAIPLGDIIDTLSGGNPSKSAWKYIILDYRLPKALTAALAGSALAISGLLMQTLFRNPLAGPFVLGISSGASLGVAILILGSSLLSIPLGAAMGNWALTIAASVGSFAVLLIVIAAAARIKDTMALLIIGLMVGSLTAAVVSVLAYFSKAEELQRYIFWSFGSLGNLSWQALAILSLCWTLGLTLTIVSLKPLNALLLGDAYAKTLGVNLNRSRLFIILATSLLAGSVTAFAGPIAFIGLAVPHLIRQVLPTANHRVLVPAVLLGGAILLLLCDIIASVPFSEYTLPINAIMALVGAPVVIWLLVRKRKLIF